MPIYQALMDNTGVPSIKDVKSNIYTLPWSRKLDKHKKKNESSFINRKKRKET
jgi:hypothetical protein